MFTQNCILRFENLHIYITSQAKYPKTYSRRRRIPYDLFFLRPIIIKIFVFVSIAKLTTYRPLTLYSLLDTCIVRHFREKFTRRQFNVEITKEP